MANRPDWRGPIRAAPHGYGMPVSSRRWAVAIVLWVLAGICLALTLFALDGWTQAVALAGYVVAQGAAIFYPRTTRPARSSDA
jgi:hypothetical protein